MSPPLKWTTFTDEVKARAYAALADKLHGYPRRGTDSRGVPAGPEVYKPGAYGWTGLHTVSPAEDGQRWAVAVSEDTDAKLAADTKLTPAEKTSVAAALAARVPLPDDWCPSAAPTEPEGGGGGGTGGTI